ncbi:MAG TPA: hypothetical protein VK013_03015 [Myxococcaceae bacterium]|nr:hypothetical protein [Myxococcaceae bacterium]
MIRVVTLDSYDPKHVELLCRTLYTAFGVGAEHEGELPLPRGLNEPIDARELLEKAPKVTTFTDDKVLYVTPRKLAARNLASGSVPTPGFALYGEDRAVISTHGVKDFEEELKVIGRNALQQLGHLWELHHCLDPRCSMYPPWTPSFVTGDSIFCTFCRDKSEKRIRLTNS